MVTTGMRVGEAAGLIWRYVDLSRYAVVIRQAVKAGGGIGPPKNGEARAALFPRRTRAVLAWWREQTPLRQSDDFVFPGSDGRYLDPKTVQRVITGRTVDGKHVDGVLDRVGVDRSGRSLSCHSLRVTYNTPMRPLLPEAVLQYIMGHKTRAMTDRYDGSAPEDRIESLLRPARKQIEAAWR